MKQAHSQKAGSSPTRCVKRRGGLSRVIALSGLFVICMTASANADDSQPTAQAKAINGEFLANLPAPSSGSKAICVIDTGITSNTDLEGKIVGSYATDGGTTEDIGTIHHGTLVAMAAAATGSNGWGSTGIWPALKVMSVRANSPGDPDHYTWEQYGVGVDYCAAMTGSAGVSLAAINLSLGSTSPSSSELDALNETVIRARNLRNVSVVAAAGNAGASSVEYPARFESAFAVGGTDAGGGDFCSWSNRGTGLDISAPGCGLNVSDTLGAMQNYEGTSLAAPMVSAVLAALRSYRTDLTAAQAEQLLLDTAQTTSAGKVLDAEAAFRSAGLGNLVDQYAPPASEIGSSTTGTAASSGTGSGSSTQTSTTGSSNRAQLIDDLYPWVAPSIRAQWRSTSGAVYVKLENVPDGVSLRTTNGSVQKTVSLKGKYPIVRIKQSRISKAKIKIRFIGGNGLPGEWAKVSGYWPLPGRCIHDDFENRCYTSTGKKRNISRRDKRAIRAALKRWKRYEVAQKRLGETLT